MTSDTKSPEREVSSKISLTTVLVSLRSEAIITQESGNKKVVTKSKDGDGDLENTEGEYKRHYVTYTLWQGHNAVQNHADTH